MIALRYTSNRNETGFRSEDQVNKVMYDGLCAYDITDEIMRMQDEGYKLKDAIEICALRQVKYDNWHASNSNGNYVVFDADFIGYDRDNQDYLGNRAVIAKLNEYIAYGQIDLNSKYYACKSIETTEDYTF